MLPSRRLKVYLLVLCWLLLPSVARAEQPVLRIGLQTLPGPWTIRGPATITMQKGDFTVETVELPTGEDALVTECYNHYILAAGETMQYAELLAATLRGCGMYASVRSSGADYLVDVFVEHESAERLKRHGLLPDISLRYGGLCIKVGDRRETVLSVEVKSGQAGVAMMINSRPHRGAISFAFFSPVKPSAVVTLAMDQYLQGVVPEEMPASWPLPALQAQAVAARTYALKNVGKHWQERYDLCDTTHCQVYGGVSAECESSNHAVTTTSRVVITWQGRLIDAVYHSHAGGYTVSGQHAWGHHTPYLIGQPIPEEPPYVWSLELTATELERLLGQRLPVAYLHGLQAAEYGEGRRVVSVGLQSLIGPDLLAVKDLRLAVGVNRLRSSCFTVTAYSADGCVVVQGDGHTALRRPIPYFLELAVVGGCFAGMLPEKPAYFRFQGTGYGHGVGMSQWGAFGMANLGYSYKEILYRFYRGISLIDYR